MDGGTEVVDVEAGTQLLEGEEGSAAGPRQPGAPQANGGHETSLAATDASRWLPVDG